MITYILLAAFFIIEIYKAVYPNEYKIILNVAKNDLIIVRNNLEPRLIYMAYNTIYFYSCGEIYLNKLRLFINPYIIIMAKCIKYFLKKNNIIKYDNENNNLKLVLDFFYEGQILISLDFDKNNKEDIIDKSPIKYDFIVCSDFSKSTSVNKICVSNIKHYFEYVFDFETTDFMFMSLRLFWKENNFTIELKNDKHNFYIVNNVLDKKFFVYYLKYILNLDNLEENITYKIELLDQDVNMRNLTDKDSIILNKENYIIVNLDNNDINK